MNFKSTVEEFPEISSCFQSGLQALGPDSKYVVANNPRLINWSVNLDDCLKTAEPNSNRWDYILAYNGIPNCLEIHPANEGEVKTMVKKAAWLNNFLKSNSPTLNQKPYHWVASGKIGILPSSPKARILAQSGITFPKSRLELK